MGVPTLGISKLPLGSPNTKCHLGAGHVAKHKVYYKEEGGGFPPSLGYDDFYESEFACSSSMHQKYSNYAH